MLIGLVAAYRSEASVLLGLLDSVTKETVNGVKLWRGGIGPHRVVTALCGAGPERTAESLLKVKEVLDKSELVIDFGVCGALDTSVPLSEVVVMDSVAAVHHSSREPIRLEQLPSGGETVRDGGCLVTHNAPVFDPRVAELLARRFGAGFVDMEAWEVASYCRERKIPVAVVKAVSDHADGSSVEGHAVRARLAAEKCALAVHGLASGL
ncbi:MAG: hypothetical protein FVQ81_14595 [Candidatus Glassbacteria bacterium]|nr:hypothetical protein [Candidatus Glassbacteria bacterium]